jgi:hypothetical protein
MILRTFPLTVLWLLGSAVAAWVFSLYLQPAFAQLLAEQLWMCF